MDGSQTEAHSTIDGGIHQQNQCKHNALLNKFAFVYENRRRSQYSSISAHWLVFRLELTRSSCNVIRVDLTDSFPNDFYCTTISCVSELHQ